MRLLKELPKEDSIKKHESLNLDHESLKLNSKLRWLCTLYKNNSQVSFHIYLG